MFGVFSKKMDKAAAQAFWDWFSKEEDWIIKTYRINEPEVVTAIDKRLKPVFPYFRKKLQFQLVFQIGKGEFFFYHMGNRKLSADAAILKDMMPRSLAHHWDLMIEK